MIRRLTILAVLALVSSGLGRDSADLDIEAVVDQAYRRDSLTRAAIDDLTYSAESYVRKLKGDGTVKEEKIFHKTYFFKDTLFKTEFVDYYKNGEPQSEKELRKAIKEDRKRGRSRDASVNVLYPFYPDKRADYQFHLLGVESKAGYTCYHVVADCFIEDEDLLEGDYWFETEGLNPVVVEFHPARLPGPIKQLEMEKSFAPVEEGLWLPQRFRLYGRGKVMLFIKFNFEVEEFYSNYRINTSLPVEFFREEKNNEN